MVSSRIIRRIELNWEAIVKAFLESARRDARLTSYRHVDDYELKVRVEDLVRNLGNWISSSNEVAIVRQYESLGALRHSQGVPLSDLVAKLQALEEILLCHVQWENSAQTAIEIYGELELVRAIRTFFRHVIYGVIRGYEAPGQRNAA
jgi:hypothetical protein